MQTVQPRLEHGIENLQQVVNVSGMGHKGKSHESASNKSSTAIVNLASRRESITFQVASGGKIGEEGGLVKRESQNSLWSKSRRRLRRQ